MSLDEVKQAARHWQPGGVLRVETERESDIQREIAGIREHEWDGDLCFECLTECSKDLEIEFIDAVSDDHACDIGEVVRRMRDQYIRQIAERRIENGEARYV